MENAIEVKNLKKSFYDHQVLKNVSISVKNGEIFLTNMFISPYEEGNRFNHDERRERKLLLHKKEIYKIRDKVDKEGYSLVPVKLYLKDGKAKILLGVAKGKKLYDKRQSIKEKDIKRDLDKIKARY